METKKYTLNSETDLNILKSKYKEARLFQKFAIYSVSLSIFSTIFASFFIPITFNYSQYIQSNLEPEIEFCQQRVGNLYYEFENIEIMLNKNYNYENKKLFRRRRNVPNEYQKRFFNKRLNRQNYAVYNVQPSFYPSKKTNYPMPEQKYANPESKYAVPEPKFAAPESKYVFPKVAMPISRKSCMCAYGPPGLIGLPGQNGLPGKDGEPGNNGIPGEDAPIDATEELPEFNVDCPPGPQGPMGPIGFPGIIGPPGLRGPPGLPGKKGNIGLQGLPGPGGPRGIMGEKGSPGSPGTTYYVDLPGPSGPEGLKGDPGPMGLPGMRGRPGNMGLLGLPGCPGNDGLEGKQGLPGRKGERGPNGLKGTCDHCSLARTPPGY